MGLDPILNNMDSVQPNSIKGTWEYWVLVGMGFFSKRVVFMDLLSMEEKVLRSIQVLDYLIGKSENDGERIILESVVKDLEEVKKELRR